MIFNRCQLIDSSICTMSDCSFQRCVLFDSGLLQMDAAAPIGR